MPASEPKVSKAKRAANDRWDKENMTHLACKLRKEEAERFREYAKQQGTNVNALLLAYVRECIGARIENDMKSRDE